MGIFSSSYKYYAYAGSANLFEEENRPETIKSNIVQSVTTEAGLNMSNAITYAMQTDLYARARSMISYATKDDGYFFQLPTTSQGVYNGITPDVLRPFIEAEVGAPIDFRSLYWGSWDVQAEQFFIEMSINQSYMDTNFFGWKKNPGDPADTNWSPVDDEIEVPVVLSGEKGVKYYATSDNNYSIEVEGTMYQASFPWTGLEYDNKTKAYVPVSGTYLVENRWNLSQYQEGDWIRVKYRIQGNLDEYLYWTYQLGSGENPALEAQIEAAIINMSYLPIAVMMHDKVWFDEAKNSEWETSLDRLLRDLTLDPYDIKEQFLEQQKDDQSGEVWDYFIHFGVPLKTIDRGGRSYLWEFYEYLRTQVTQTTFQDYQDFLQGKADGGGGLFASFFEGGQPVTKLSVEEGVEYTGYIARYAWSYIERSEHEGSFTPPGWAEPLRAGRIWSDTYPVTDPNHAVFLEKVHGGTFGPPGAGTDYLQGPSAKIDEEEHAYTILVQANHDGTHTCLLMMGPGMEYQINTSETPVGVGQSGYVDYRYRFVDCELFPDDPEEDSEFRWPVHIASIREVSAVRREAALSDGLCSTVFLVQRVKVKFYQRGFFKWLIIILAVVLIVLSIFFPGFLAAASFLLASALGGSLLAFYIIYTILIFAVGWIIVTAGQLIGGTWGTVFAVIGMLIVGARGGLAGAPGGTGFTITAQGANAFASAVNLINSTYPYLNGGMQIYQAFALEKLQDEMEDFYSSAREKYDRLRDAWDMLGDTSGSINPINLTARMNDWYIESADDFYARSLNANPGVMSYDLINNFVNMSVTLPETPGDGNIIELVFEQFAAQRGQV